MCSIKIILQYKTCLHVQIMNRLLQCIITQKKFYSMTSFNDGFLRGETISVSSNLASVSRGPFEAAVSLKIGSFSYLSSRKHTAHVTKLSTLIAIQASTSLFSFHIVKIGTHYYFQIMPKCL